jgi:hypothetical protein
LAHAGFAIAAGRTARKGLPFASMAWLGVGGVLPDLLDKPVALLLHVNEGRLLGHTVLFALAWLGVGLAWRRPLAAPPALVGWGCLSHLLLDLPQPGTALWPLLGAAFPIRNYAISFPGGIVQDMVARPTYLVGEVAGLAVLALVAWEWAHARRATPP